MSAALFPVDGENIIQNAISFFFAHAGIFDGIHAPLRFRCVRADLSSDLRVASVDDCMAFDKACKGEILWRYEYSLPVAYPNDCSIEKYDFLGVKTFMLSADGERVEPEGDAH